MQYTDMPFGGRTVYLTHLISTYLFFAPFPFTQSGTVSRPSRPAARGKASLCAASLTAECALVLPLFLMAVLTWFSFLSLFGDCAAEQLRLSNEARTAAAYAGAAAAAREAVSDTTAAREAVSGEAGEAGLSWIDLTGAVSWRSPFFGAFSEEIQIPARARVRAFTGYRASDFAELTEDGETELVYLSEYGSVRHTHADCTHLDLEIRTADTGSVSGLRNAYGERYQKCVGFPEDYEGTVYLTAKGSCYYPSPDWPGLTRYVRAVSAAEAAELPLCERCAARDSAHVH